MWCVRRAKPYCVPVCQCLQGITTKTTHCWTTHHTDVVLEIVLLSFPRGLDPCISGGDVDQNAVSDGSAAQRRHALLQGDGAQRVGALG